MFKKLMVIVLAMVMITACGIPAYATCMSETDRPTIIGTELIDRVNELDAEGVLCDYDIYMGRYDDLWVVGLEGTNMYTGWAAMGFYDHMPDENEIDVLWANRMPVDTLNDLVNEMF